MGARVAQAEDQFRSSPNVIDFHGFRVAEALLLLRKKLAEPRRGKLLVITGAGRHSPDGKPRIRPAIINYLMQNRIQFSMVNDGALNVL